MSDRSDTSDARHNRQCGIRRHKDNWRQTCRNNRRQAGSTTTLPVVPEARQKALSLQQPGIRSDIAQPGGFCRGVREGSVLEYSTRAATTARPAPAKQDRSVNKKNGAFARARTVDPVIKSHLLYRLSYERTYCLSTLLNILLFSKNAS